MANKGPLVWSKNKAKLLNNGPIEFYSGVLLEVVDTAPSGNRPKGTVVIDKEAKLWQATDDIGGYQQFSTGASSTSFNTSEFSGTGTLLDPIRLAGTFYPSVDSTTAFSFKKADNTTQVFTIDSTNTQAMLYGKVNLGKVDAFGRSMIWNYGTNSVLKMGGIQQDGDPADVSSEGMVIIGPNSNGTFDYNNWAFVRVKSTRVGINNCIANVQNYIFRADETSLYLRNDSGTKTFEVTRSTGMMTLDSGIIRPRVNSTTAVRLTKADGTSAVVTVDTSTPKVTLNGQLYIPDLVAKALPTDADTLILNDMADGGLAKKLSIADLKALLDTLYEPLGGTMDFANKQLTGSTTLAMNEEQTLITYTVPSNTKFRWLAGTGGSSGDNMWTVKINGDTYMTKKNSYMMRDADIYLPLELAAGDVLTIMSKNVSIAGESNTVSVWLYGKEIAV